MEITVHRSENLLLVWWQYSPNWSTDYTKSLSNSPLFFPTSRNLLADSKSKVKIQGIQNSQTSRKGETNLEDSHFPILKLKLQGTVIKTVWY